jgi:large conductance mechanosensitive channel
MQRRSDVEGFRKFILRGNVVDLAVGVVIGAAFTGVVNALVKSLITPFLGIFGGVPDFSQLAFTVNNSRFAIGEFVNALLAFLLVAAVLYWFIVLPVNRLMDLRKTEEPAGPATRPCPECLSKIPIAARRCAFCTTLLVDDGRGAPAAGARAAGGVRPDTAAA